MLEKSVIEKTLNAALSTGADFAELFIEKKFKSSYQMVNREVENALSGYTFGVGIRILNDLNSVYGYTNDLSETNLIRVATNLAASFDGEATTITFDSDLVVPKNNHPILKFPNEVSQDQKIALLKKASDAAYNYDPIIGKVIVSYVDSLQDIVIANSLGKYVSDRRVHTRTSISAVAIEDGKMQDGYKAPGAHMGFEFYDQINIEEYAADAARIAKTMFYAQECPSGEMPVIIDNGFGGVIFHEACGHGLEATSVAKGNSVFANRLGEQIASSLVTLVDDGTIPNAWGSSNMDDEGNITRRNVLIEKGILKSYMVDSFNGRRMKMAPTGSTRRESYTFEPTSRMTNTFIENGDSTREEIIASTSYGLYAKNLGGGSVNTSTGEFNFAVNEGYIVKDGKIAYPVKGATLIGSGAEVLMKVDMVANNLKREQGMCGSTSGSIPADVGQPTLRVSSLTVGGRGGKN